MAAYKCDRFGCFVTNLLGFCSRSGNESNFSTLLVLATTSPFFGMPYQNFAGWLGTSSVFMAVTALLWRNNPINWERSQLNIPFAVYLSNFGFATVMSLTSGFFVPVLLGLLLGVTPAVFAVVEKLIYTCPSSHGTSRNLCS